MNKALITAVMGLSMLYAQSVSAKEVVGYDRGFVLADASSAQSAPAKGHKTTQHHTKKHHHKHHHAGKHHHVGKHHVADASGHHHAAGTSSHSGSKGHHGHHKYKKHSAQKHHHHHYKHEKHYRKHHQNRPHRGYHCPTGDCDEDSMGMMERREYMRSQAVMNSPDAQVNDMDIINRDHAARAGRGR